MSEIDARFGPMIEPLRQRFGVTFDHWMTGGGCTALVGEMEGDVAVYVTDAPGSVNGEELTITDQPTRLAVGESTVGFAVGVYRDDHQINITYREYPEATTAQLPDLVAEQLAEAVEQRRKETP